MLGWAGLDRKSKEFPLFFFPFLPWEQVGLFLFSVFLRGCQFTMAGVALIYPI